MNNVRYIDRTCTLAIVAAVCCFTFSGCLYEVPITAKPTRKIDERLLGDWTSKDGQHKMKVVKLDDSNYIVCKRDKDGGVFSSGDLFRVYHSDVAKTAFVSVQILDKPKPSYAYWNWKLSEDGTLHLRCVNDKVVPDETKDSASVRKLLEGNLQNPNLFGEDNQFTKDK
ncbi:MAG: hypothetical protein ABSH14_05510 [Verrucomicrobiia bacterium]|jgi:hypothetical protein